MWDAAAWIAYGRTTATSVPCTIERARVIEVIAVRDQKEAAISDRPGAAVMGNWLSNQWSEKGKGFLQYTVIIFDFCFGKHNKGIKS